MAEIVRFVHCGGFRFDSPAWEGPQAWRGMREKDLWQTFESVLALCQTEEADFLFITGDLFDQDYTRKETVERVSRSLARLNGIEIFITPGELDPLVISSVYRYAEWPENVHVFGEGIRSIAIRDKNSMIYGSGWTTYHQERACVENLKVANESSDAQSAVIRIMLLHAEVEAIINSENFIPLKKEEIAASGLTYMALGHQDTYSGLQKAGNTYWAECGTVEARSFQEIGPHGVILGETDGNTIQINYVELCQRRYLENKLYFSSGNFKAEIRNSIHELLKDINEEARQRDLFRFRLLGTVIDNTAACNVVQEILSNKFGYFEVITAEGSPVVEDATTPELKEVLSSKKDLEASKLIKSNHIGYPSLNQIFRYETEERITDTKQPEDKRHWELVQRIGLAAISQAISQEQEAYED